MGKASHSGKKDTLHAPKTSSRPKIDKHKRRALLLTILIELLIIISLIKLHFSASKTSETIEINLVKDNFDFSQLQSSPSPQIPDITPYLNQNQLTTLASNEWQRENAEEETYREQMNNKEDDSPEDKEEILSDLTPDKKAFIPRNKPTPADKITSFKGQSRIRYFVKGRHKTYLANPIYTCPGYMHGWITIRITVDRMGKVIHAVYDPQSSTASYECLIEAALKSANHARFNVDSHAPSVVTGYIQYFF